MIFPIKVEVSLRGEDAGLVDLPRQIRSDPIQTYRLIATTLDTADGSMRRYEFESMRVVGQESLGQIVLNPFTDRERLHLERLRDELVRILGPGPA